MIDYAVRDKELMLLIALFVTGFLAGFICAFRLFA